MPNSQKLYTAQELENILGEKYFYRQGLYRLADCGEITAFEVNSVLYLSKDEVVTSTLNRLAERIASRHPWIPHDTLWVRYDEKSKKVVIYGFSKDETIEADTTEETEADILGKVEDIRKEVKNMPDVPVKPHHDMPPPPPHHGGPHHKLPPHEEMMDMLRRIDERLRRIEEKLDR